MAIFGFMQDEVDRLVAAWRRERPDLDTRPLEVLSRVTRLARHLDRARRSAFTEHDLEAWEFDVLSALRRSGEPYQLSPGALLNQTLVTSGTMTNRIDRLTDQGAGPPRAGPGRPPRRPRRPHPARPRRRRRHPHRPARPRAEAAGRSDGPSARRPRRPPPRPRLPLRQPRIATGAHAFWPPVRRVTPTGWVRLRRLRRRRAIPLRGRRVRRRVRAGCRRVRRPWRSRWRGWPAARAGPSRPPRSGPSGARCG